VSAYAEAMFRKLEDMYECIERHLNDVGLTIAPRVVGQYCPWPCIDPLLVIDHNIQPYSAFLLNGHRYQGRA
jgi:hypothetical protein